MRRGFYIFAVVMLILNVEVQSFKCVGAESAVLTVPDDFSTIQEAINSAIVGDTVFVKAGIYYEYVVVNKSISLVGENCLTTMVDGNGTGTAVLILSNSVNVTGFTVQRGHYGIYIQNSNYANISNNIVALNYGSEWDAGIHLDSASNTKIFSNIITNNAHGISFTSSSDNSVCENNITANIFDGFWLSHSNSNSISGNNITANSGTGVNFDSSSSNTVCENQIKNNLYGIYVCFSSANTIYHNNFAKNLEHVHPSTVYGEEPNVWDDEYPSGGNYWSDYQGTDANSDGIGDTPYVINVNNRDNYPLMDLWSPNVWDWTVDDDGPADFSTIQEAINTASDGDTILVKAGTYYEHVVVNRTLSLLGEEVTTTIIDGNETGRVIDIMSDNVNVTGFTVRRGGDIMFPDYDAGISIRNSRDCRISNNNVVDNGCFGIHLLESDRNIVSENNLTRNTMYAIDLTSSNSNTISSNTALSNGNIGIGLHYSSQNNTIFGNTVLNNTYGIDAAKASNNTILDNRLANNSETGIWIQDYAINNTIFGNSVTGSGCCIKMEGQANSNTVSGNVLTDGRFGIQILNAEYTEICNNRIAHNHGSGWGTGVHLDSAGYTVIHDNEITDNWRAIHIIASSPNVSIYRNNVTYNEFGIRVLGGGSSYLNVSGNFVANNRGYGVAVTGIEGESNYAFISRNVVVNNIDGIALGQGSNYNTIVQNNISQNEYGIGMQYSTQNSILNNNIMNNTQQVSITSGSVNTWNGSYVSGGNYWSDYSGLDQFGGPCQNLTGSDGIGDTPFAIDSNNIDHYPLMVSWTELSNLVGDVNADGKVDMKDVGYVSRRFMCVPGDLLWDGNADFNGDGKINMVDIGTVARHFGESLP